MAYFIKNGDISYSDFVYLIKRINVATSVSGVEYIDIYVEGEKVVGIRQSTGKPFGISLKDLYEAYNNVAVFTTTELKPYVGGVQSPSLAILIAINAVKPSDGEKIKTDGQIISVGNKDGAGTWIKKSLLTFIICGIFVVLGKCCAQRPVENGRLTDAAYEQAVIAIKSQISDPSSYKGGSWQDAIWDSNSLTKRYVVKHEFTQTNSWGERERSIAFIYLDVEGKPTDIEIMKF